jgi:uncharacterized protein (TIGR02001 family)
MKKIFLATAIAVCAAAPTAVLAQDQPSGAGGPHTFTANIGLFSEYIFRGVTQTGGEPAVQGGFDYSHTSGIYVGTWASNISWLQDFKVYEQSSVEWDFYGGIKRNIGDTDFFFDVGTIYYWFPGNKIAGWSANTWEIYAGAGWKWLGVRASYSLRDYFGARPNANQDATDGTIYWDFFANYPVGETGLTLMAHYGILDVKNDGSRDLGTEVSYNDWRLGVSYLIPTTFLKGTEIGAFYTDTDVKDGQTANTNFYRDLTTKAMNTADSAFVVYVKKTF